MVAERKMIDLEDIAGGDALASELDRHPDGLILRRGGREIAMIVPGNEIDRRLAAIPVHGVDGSPLPNGGLTSDQIEQLLAAIHDLAPLIDAEQMHRSVEESRQLSIAEQRRRWQSDDSEG